MNRSAWAFLVTVGICKELLNVIQKIGWNKPSEVQAKAIPHALNGKDIVGLAETGSGKTAAFAIPILQALIKKPKHNFALILTPTRELALQLKSHFLMLAEDYGLKVITLIGGQHLSDQVKMLKSSKYHIIIGTPGRVVYHLENSKELRLNRVKYFILDEADQMLDDTFEAHLSSILAVLPDHRTYMFSATMNEKLEYVKSILLNSPILIEANQPYTTVDQLDHAFTFLPDDEREFFLIHLLSLYSKQRAIVFTTTWRESFRLASLLKSFSNLCGVAAPLNGNMQQDKRQSTLFKFRSGQVTVLVATDLAARGLDIPEVDLVVNYDLPNRPSWSDSAKAYLHRVGRTARAGRMGRALTLVTPYSAVRLKAIESALGKRISQLTWPGKQAVLNRQLREQIMEADANSRASIREYEKKKGAKKRKRSSRKDDQDALKPMKMSSDDE